MSRPASKATPTSTKWLFSPGISTGKNHLNHLKAGKILTTQSKITITTREKRITATRSITVARRAKTCQLDAQKTTMAAVQAQSASRLFILLLKLSKTTSILRYRVKNQKKTISLEPHKATSISIKSTLKRQLDPSLSLDHSSPQLFTSKGNSSHNVFVLLLVPEECGAWSDWKDNSKSRIQMLQANSAYLNSSSASMTWRYLAFVRAKWRWFSVLTTKMVPGKSMSRNSSMPWLASCPPAAWDLSTKLMNRWIPIKTRVWALTKWKVALNPQDTLTWRLG